MHSNYTFVFKVSSNFEVTPIFYTNKLGLLLSFFWNIFHLKQIMRCKKNKAFLEEEMNIWKNCMHSGKWNINIQFVILSDFIHMMLKWQTISVNITPQDT